jgi:hypothetical protein
VRDRLGHWFERNPLIVGVLAIGMGGGFFAILLSRLREVLGILDLYFPPGASRQSINRGILWTGAIAGAFTAAAVIQRKWWKKSTLRRWVLGAMTAPPALALLATAPGRHGDPPGAGLCATWPCVASSHVVWMAVAVAFVVIGVKMCIGVLRGRHSRLHRMIRGWSRPTGLPCRSTITALPRDHEAPDLGWVYFFDCACGVVGRAWPTAAEAEADAREHAPDQIPTHDIPSEARQGPPTPFPV